MKEIDKNDYMQGVIVVRKEHIKRGIDRYNARVDLELKSILDSATFNATPYLFDDQRVLLVYDLSDHALLFDSLETLYSKLALE